MTFNHLNFDELSDLIDDELSEENKQNCNTHLNLCSRCSGEYAILTRYVTLLSTLKNENLAVPDISNRIIMICRSRERKKIYIKAIPAIAASIMIIIGAGFIKAGFFNETGSYISTNLTGQNEIQKIIESVSKSDGRIVQITESFIDSEFDKKDLVVIKRFLHNNKIKYAQLVNPGILADSSTGLVEDIKYSNNIFPQGTTQSYNTYKDISSLKNRKIRMRIFK